MNTPAKRVTRVQSDIDDALIGVRRLKALVAARCDDTGLLEQATGVLCSADGALHYALNLVCDAEDVLVRATTPEVAP